jgi:decaprenylphospho-beta-D-ribofuranose 2-oxidase
MKQIETFLGAENTMCFLVAVKRFKKPEREGPLTFAQEGFSISMDIAMTGKLPGVLSNLDEIVDEHGGRVNIIKDARLSPEMLRRMYPRLNEWLSVKERYDPKNVFRSNLSRRLRITAT